jgi:hypothetical protein
MVEPLMCSLSGGSITLVWIVQMNTLSPAACVHGVHVGLILLFGCRKCSGKCSPEIEFKVVSKTSKIRRLEDTVHIMKKRD